VRNRKLLIGAGAALLVTAFLAGVVQLFELRFSGGDIYPAYSSLRSDPFGTKALYESLERVPGAAVARHLKPLGMLEGAEGAVFYTGVNPWSFRYSSQKQLELFEAVLKRGARLVIAFEPVNKPVAAMQQKSKTEERWGLRLSSPPPRTSDKPPADEDEEESSELPRQTLLYFDHLDKSWQTLQSAAGQPAVIARSLGNGSVVLVANGYLLSNEALQANRDTALLASIIGGPVRRFTFDEYHFGVAETGSLAALARKYGLQGLVAGLLLLAALFVWQSSASFLPPREAEDAEVLGKSAVSGFVNLLRRGVPIADLLPLCAKEWRKSLAMGTFCSTEKQKQIEEVLTARGGDPLASYQRISRILAERKTL
jgi:hypothetical protein